MKSNYPKMCSHSYKEFRLENGEYVYTFKNFKFTRVIKLSMELNDGISELKDSIGEVHATITPEMCHQSDAPVCSHVLACVLACDTTSLSVRPRLQPCVQPGGQCFDDLRKVTNLRFR